MFRHGPARSGKVHTDLPNSFRWSFSQQRLAGYTSMYETGIIFYRERSLLQTTRQLFSNTWALLPFENSGTVMKVTRPRSCSTVEWMNILTGEAENPEGYRYLIPADSIMLNCLCSFRYRSSNSSSYQYALLLPYQSKNFPLEITKTIIWGR